ncbi:MAG: hypothetical protein MI757_09475, partial [Pirellulales bacterium]|nr:hypothetical protein [Pirellulales bacterium]
MKKLTYVLLVTLSASILTTAAASGPPNSSNPTGVLPLVRGAGETPFATPREIRAKLMREVPIAAKAVERLRKALRSEDLRKVKRLEVARVFGDLARLGRGAGHLALWGEPSSVGLRAEVATLMRKHNELIVAMKEDELHKARLLREYKASGNAANRRLDMMERIVDPLIAKGQIAKAYEALMPIQDDVMSILVFYDRKRFESKRARLEKRLADTKEPYRNLQIQAVFKSVGAVRDRYAPNYDRLWRGVEDIILKVKNDEPVEAGPVLLKKFAGGWAKTHLAGLRCQAYDWVLASGVSAYTGEEKKAWQAKRKKLIEDHNKFTTKMTELVISLIEADVNRSTPEQIEKLYPEYLEAVSLLVALQGKGFRDKVQAALDKMAAQSTSLSQQIADYDAATGDLLRWRRKIALAHAAKAKRTFSPLDAALRRAALRSDEPPERLLKNEESPLSTLAIKSYARLPTNFMSQHVMNSKVHVSNGIGFRSAAGYPLLTLRKNRHYAGFRGDPNWIAEAIAQLESDLLIDQDRPTPLTLKAQLALAGARRGDIESAGGRISGMMLESIITRQTNLLPSDWGMVRIAPLAELALEENAGILNQVQTRFALNPLWLQNAYF